jgi:hypothetical protein
VLSLRTEDEEEEEDRYVRCDAPLLLLLEPVQRNAFSITTRCDAMRCAVLLIPRLYPPSFFSFLQLCAAVILAFLPSSTDEKRRKRRRNTS